MALVGLVLALLLHGGLLIGSLILHDGDRCCGHGCPPRRAPTPHQASDRLLRFAIDVEIENTRRFFSASAVDVRDVSEWRLEQRTEPRDGDHFHRDLFGAHILEHDGRVGDNGSHLFGWAKAGHARELQLGKPPP